MVAAFYTRILERYLLPFIQEKFPGGTHRFMQDNDPEHKSRLAKNFSEASQINWWKTPPESPNLNPIENLWHELKKFLRARVKPHNQRELIAGIKSLWATVMAKKCCKYIRHLNKVIPKVIELQGDATGY